MRYSGELDNKAKGAVAAHAVWLRVAMVLAIAGCLLACGLVAGVPALSWADEEDATFGEVSDLTDDSADVDGAGDASSASPSSQAGSSAASPAGGGSKKDAAGKSDDDDDDDESDSDGDSDLDDDIDKGPAEVGDSSAMADALDKVNGQIEEKLAEVEKITAEIEAARDKAANTEAKIAKLDKKIDGLLDDIEERQEEQAKLKKHASELTRNMYRNRGDLSVLNMLDGVGSFNEALEWMEMRDRVLNEYDSVMGKLKDTQADLQERYEQASAEKDAQVELTEELAEEQEELAAKQKRLEKTVAQLRKRADRLDVDQKARLSEAAAAAHEIAETFKTGELADVDGAKWYTGLASAYGGSTDDATPQDTPTATGTMCDDYSMGVAVPMAWGPSKYYGHRVEISYEGRSVIATVVDCGGMNDGERALDLQPGVFRAFGAENCEDWGVRKVRYRFL